MNGSTWLTDDQCPTCGTDLQCTDSSAAITLDCPACGWTTTYDAASQTGGR
jgi:ribosomal protein S27E